MLGLLGHNLPHFGAFMATKVVCPVVNLHFMNFFGRETSRSWEVRGRLTVALIRLYIINGGLG